MSAASELNSLSICSRDFPIVSLTKNQEKTALKASIAAKNRNVAHPMLVIMYGVATDQMMLKIH